MNASYLIYFAWFGILVAATFSMFAAYLWGITNYVAVQAIYTSRFVVLCALAVACFLPVLLICKKFVNCEVRIMRKVEGAVFALVFGALTGLVGYCIVMIVGFLDDPNIADHPFSPQETVGFGIATMLYGAVFLFVPNCLVLWGYSRFLRLKLKDSFH